MKSRYDPEADILYVRFSEAEILESEEVAPGVVLDFDAEGRIVAIEFQKAASHLARGVDLEDLKVA